MLQRLGNRDRDEWDDRPEHDYGRVDPVTDDDRDYPDHFARRKTRRRSVGRRVTFSVFLALTLIGGAVALYFAYASGGLGGLLAGTPETTAPSVDAASHVDAGAVAPPAAPSQQQAPAAAASAAAQQAPVPMPSVEGLGILIRNAIVALDQANRAGNYSVLRDLAAPDFQAANSPADLTQIFAELRSRNVNLAQIAAANPSLLAEPAIDAQGLLRLTGFFPTGEMRANFDLLFQPLDGRWRLYGIGVAPEAPPADGSHPPAPAAQSAGAIPDAPIMLTLVRDAVIALNQANLSGNYSVLRDIAAPGFQQANDLTKLAAVFADLRGRQLDLSPVAIIDPQLFRAPAIDQDGFLRLTGFFPSRPEQVNFDLAFQFDRGAWRLFGLGLNTSREEPAESAAVAPAGPATPAGQGGNVANDAVPAAAPADPAPRAVAAPPVPRLRPQ